MQPNNPPSPNPPVPPPARRSVGPGFLVGVLILMGLIYLTDQASNGQVAIFSGLDRRITEQEFEGGQYTALFGGCKIDLREAQIRGDQAVLKTYAVFGGVEIRVPRDWKVVNRGVAIFGGFNDSSRRGRGEETTKTLIVDGAAVFGGVQIKD